MIDLVELMRRAQGGAALEALSRQAGIGPQQMQAALDALMPAFAVGLQKNAADPAGLAGLLGLLGSGRYNAFFQSPDNAFPPDAAAWGEHALRQMFGGMETTRTVASQAAALSGLAPGVIQQLLPFIAGVIVGGMVHAAANQGAAAKPAGTQAPNPFEIFGASFLGRPQPPAPPAPPAPEAAAPLPNPFMDLLGAFLAGAVPAAEMDLPAEDPARSRSAQAAPQPAPRDPPPAPEAEGTQPDGGDFVDRLVQTGLDVQNQQIENWKRILDAFDARDRTPDESDGTKGSKGPNKAKGTKGG